MEIKKACKVGLAEAIPRVRAEKAAVEALSISCEEADIIEVMKMKAPTEGRQAVSRNGERRQEMANDAKLTSPRLAGQF